MEQRKRVKKMETKGWGKVTMMPQIDWILVEYVLCRCVQSPTLGICWVDKGFINNYKTLNCA